MSEKSPFNLIVTTQRGNENACMRELAIVSGEADIRFSRTGFPGLITCSVRGDPVEFCRRLKAKVEEDPWRVRFLLKAVPIQAMARAEVSEIKSVVKRLAETIPPEASFRITVNKRGSEIRTSDLIREIAPLIERKVDLEDPDFVVDVEIIRDLAGVSVISPVEIVSVTKMQEAALERE